MMGLIQFRFHDYKGMAFLARLVFTPFVVVVGGKYFFAGAGMPIF